MSRRVRVAVSALSAGRRELPREAAHYLTVVHRLGAGAAFSAFDPEQGLAASGRIVESVRNRVVCEIDAPEPLAPGGIGVTLLQCACKGERLDQVIRAATALGADAVWIVVSERSVARPDDARRERLRAIAIDAARQCERSDLPRIEGPLPLGAALSAVEDGVLKLCLSPDAETPLAEHIVEWRARARAALLVGPEGGLSDDEVASAVAHGFREAGLGPHTLRSELAATAALAAFAARVPRTERISG